MVRETSLPGGLLSSAIPMLVRVSTEDPGSSARTVAYRADHLEVNWGPSMSSVITKVGPTARTKFATGSCLARSSQISIQRTSHLLAVMNDNFRASISEYSHHRTIGSSEPPMPYCST